MTTKPALYAVILAGGGGTRLWPLSRQRLPKHLLALCSDRTLLAQTYERIEPLVSADHVLVITVAEHAAAARAQLQGLPAGNVVAEPLGRGTGPAVGLMAMLIHKRDPDALMISLHADHAIEDEEGFHSVLLAAVEAAKAGHLVTLGITPSSPQTGYGYIQRGERIAQMAGHDLYSVSRFTEKPDRQTAAAFVQTGHYYWNSGIFVWRPSALLAEIRRQRPRLYAQLQALEPALDTAFQNAEIERVWREVESVSVDVGVMEGAADVAMLPANIGWSDVGSWSSVASQAQADGDGNVLLGEHLALDCNDTYIYSSGRLVAALGLEGMVVIETEDAVLVCPKERAQEVRTVVTTLKRQGRERYL